jgi:protein-disulfide isomerase
MAVLTAAALVVGALIIVYAVATRPGQSNEVLTPPVAAVPAVAIDGRTMGSSDAPVKVEIWSDFQCPGCRALATRIEPTLISQYVVPGYAQLIYRDAAFQGRKVPAAWDESEQAAAAARCAADQGRFWHMHDWLFANWAGENEGGFRQERLRAIATEAELDVAAYEACMAAGDKQQAASSETDQALALGVNQTPTIVLNGTPYDGPITASGLGQAIMAAAGDASPAPAP